MEKFIWYGASTFFVLPLHYLRYSIGIIKLFNIHWQARFLEAAANYKKKIGFKGNFIFRLDL